MERVPIFGATQAPVGIGDRQEKDELQFVLERGFVVSLWSRIFQTRVQQ
jgi:hypothetical protein